MWLIKWITAELSNPFGPSESSSLFYIFFVICKGNDDKIFDKQEAIW